MKRTIVSVGVLVSVAFAGVLPVFASTNGNSHGRSQRTSVHTPKPTHEPLNADAAGSLYGRTASRAQELHDQIASRSAAVKARVTKAKQQQLQRWWDNTQRRLDALITRQGKLADKIQQRITTLSGKGVDVTAAQNALNDAKTKVTAAGQALTDAGNQVAGIIANNTPADAFKKLHDLQKNVMSAIRTAQQAVVKAAVAVRQSIPTPTPKASPTPTPTAS